MELTDKGKQLFNALKDHCQHEMGFLNIDDLGLEVLACAFERFESCQEILDREGLTQVAVKTGFLVVRPEVGIQKTAMEIIKKYSDAFGLSPQSRKKILGKKKEVKQPFQFDLTE